MLVMFTMASKILCMGWKTLDSASYSFMPVTGNDSQ